MIFIFLWGRTGSGKSTSVRLLNEIVDPKGWSSQSFNDYIYLREMFEADTEGRFRATDHDGFEVLDLSVYEAAIRSLARQIQDYQPEHERTLVTIEFTSNNYRDALGFFDDALLQKAYFFFISADLKICLERVNQRTLHPIAEDDYFVPDVVLLKHYPSPYMPPYIDSKRTKLIQNMAEPEILKDQLQLALEEILSQEKLVERVAELVPC